MKHIILTLIALIAMFTFWRSVGGPLTAREHSRQEAQAAETEQPEPAQSSVEAGRPPFNAPSR